ncbi:ATP-binding protein, partial [Chloroflexota bacterium]
LRTPLNGILGYTQILKRDKRLTAKQSDGIDIIHRSGEHLLMMINDVLDLSKIEAGKMELIPIEFYLPGFLKTIAEIIRVRAKQKGISFTYETLSSLPSGVCADEVRLRQVLLNLIGNAVKFTEQGGVTFKVGYVDKEQWAEAKGNSQRTEHKIRFEIEDTGIGISPEKQAEIFLPFHQVGERQTQTEGTGLGLAISQRLVELMGGELQVESPLTGGEIKEGQGSRFWFEVTLSEVVWDTETAKIEWGIVGYTLLDVDNQKGLKILIVDDQADNRFVLRDICEPLGFEILEAVNGHDALAKATEFQPDLILMDLVMPEMDGFAATKRIRQIPELKDVVVIAISASVSDSVKEQSLAAGCDDYVAKPFEVGEFFEKLPGHLSLKWIYEDSDKTQDTSVDLAQTRLIPPPAAELAVLYELVLNGDIGNLREQVQKMGTLDPKFMPFITKIGQLANEFRVNEIQNLIERYMENKK